MSDTVLESMERELLAWGAYVAGGRDGNGFPVMSVIHPNWQPPAKGMTPKAPRRAQSYIRERRMDAAVRHLSGKLQDALAVRYVKRMSCAEQARVLGCQPGTLDARVREAKRQLVGVLPVVVFA